MVERPVKGVDQTSIQDLSYKLPELICQKDEFRKEKEAREEEE